MTPSPLLIRELDRIARDRGWSSAKLASFLGVDETLLAHIRAGRKRCSTETLSRIAVRFGDSSVVRNLVWHYLAVEHPEKNAADPIGDRSPLPQVASELPATARKALRAYVVGFFRAYYEGRGLVVVSAAAKTLGHATSFLVSEFARRGVPVMTLNGSARITSTEGRAALAARLVIVERIERASESCLALLSSRASLTRPFVLTSTVAAPISDPHLARIVAARTSEVRVLDVPASSPASSATSHA